MRDARDRARDFVVFCDGIEEAGLVQYARHGRDVARLLVEALDALEAERSSALALLARCERQQAILGKRADDAIAEAQR